MNVKSLFPKWLSGETGVFVLLWLIYILLPYVVVPDRYGYSLGVTELLLKSMYLVPVLINNGLLIPRLLYKSRYWLYVAVLLVMAFATGLFEEVVFENVFYPGTRGGDLSFGGVQNAAFKVGFVLGLFSSFKLLWDFQKKQKQVSTLEKEKMESELKFLKSQINPHVLFNNLNNIYSYSLERSEKVPDMLLKLSQIMRYMLKEGAEPMVPLQRELEYLQNFIELQKLRLEGRGDVSFTIHGDPASYTIAPLLLVSFVENSFKHSMNTEVDDISICITVRIDRGELFFSATNTYSDIEKPAADDVSGIGLTNVRKRLNLIYGANHALHISPGERTFTVALTLNLLVDEPELLRY